MEALTMTKSAQMPQNLSFKNGKNAIRLMMKKLAPKNVRQSNFGVSLFRKAIPITRSALTKNVKSDDLR
jgi:hypothetical protein